MKLNLLYQITAASKPLNRGLRPQIPVLPVLCPQLNLLNPPEKNSWVRHWDEEVKNGRSMREELDMRLAPVV